MAKDYFSVPIFFILFRETLEASIIVSVLLSLVEQIVKGHGMHKDKTEEEILAIDPSSEDALAQKKLLKKLRIQVLGGAFVGLVIALAIGAAFIAVWFTEVKDLWGSSEELWEGIFSLIACIMIFIMSIAMLKMDRARAKWRYKLQTLFEKKNITDAKELQKGGKTAKWSLFLLPLITVLREGLEAIVFVGGVSLGQQARSIPIAAIVGLICGLLIGLIIYMSSRKINLSYFLVFSTCFLLLIGAGLFSKAVGDFQMNAFNNLTGGDAAENGNGPGSFDVRGNVWHLNCCNPEDNLNGQGWLIFNAILGWTNTATIGTILSYIFYWLAVIVVLIFMKFWEGRTKFFGKESKAGYNRRLRREAGVSEKPIEAPAVPQLDRERSESSGEETK